MPDVLTTIRAGLAAKIRGAASTLDIPSFVSISEEDGVRRAAQEIGAWASLNFHEAWSASRKMEGPIDVIDFFSGCGGMSAGFQAFNGVLPTFRLAMAVDIDVVANESFARNLGLTPVAEDVSRLARDPGRLAEVVRGSRRRPGHPLVLIGCAPCQGFSSHRNGDGDKDARNALFVDFAHVAIALDPEVIVVENVPEVLTNKYWPVVKDASDLLRQAGYYVHLGVHNMATAGLPQERFRAVLLAMKRPFRAPRGFLPRDHFRTVRHAIGDLRAVGAGERPEDDPMHFSANHRPSTIEVIRAVPKDGGNRPADVGPDCLRRASDRQGKPAYEDVYGRLYWDRPAITITAYARNPASGRFVHPEQERGLTAREGALLQGFPRDYSYSGGLDGIFRQIGNAVPPRFASFLAGHILGEVATPVLPEADHEGGLWASVGRSFSRLIPALKETDTLDLTELVAAR